MRGGRHAGKKQGTAEDPFAYLHVVDPKERYDNALSKEVKMKRRLEQLMGQPLRADRLGLEARRRQMLLEDSRSPASATASSPGAASSAPRYVGLRANEYAKAMSVERIHRFREESSASVQTVRQAMRMDDSTSVEMAMRPQGVDGLTLKIFLTQPLDDVGPEAAKRRVMREAGEALAGCIGRCRVFAGGRVLEVFYDTSKPRCGELPEALRGLGRVEPQGTPDTSQLLAALRFDGAGRQHERVEVRAGPVRPPHLWETRPAVRSADGGRRSRGARSTPELHRGGDGEQPQEGEGDALDFASLQDAIARWDSKLKASSFYRDAVEMVGGAGWRG